MMPRDVTIEGFTAWRRRQTASVCTINHYLDSINGLLNWIQRQGQIAGNPLADLDKIDARGRATSER